jgi:class 3 adenylate cyclase
MEIKRVCMVLADISGYTRFMKLHTMSLLHAEAIITDLLEAVIDHAEYPLTLSKLEGDAVFLYAPLSDNEAAVTRDVVKQVIAFFEAFKAKERSLIACDQCQCDACSHIDQLKLKAMLHCGEVVIKKIRQFEELGGEEVILIHRLLKNTIPAKEYILMTDAFYQLSGGLADQTAETRIEECEGIGPVTIQVYYPKADTPFPPRPEPGPPKAGTKFGDLAAEWNQYAVRRMLGREPKREFSHLPTKRLSPLSLLSYFVGGIGGNIAATISHQRAKKKEQSS